MRTSASVAVKSVCSNPARRSRNRCARNRSNRKTGRTGREDSLTRAVLSPRLRQRRTTNDGSMRRIRYSKYVPDPAGEMSMEDLLGALSDYLLQSGFQNYFSYSDSPDGEHTLDELRRAIERALLEGDLMNDELREQLQQMQGEGSLEELVEQLVQRMQQEDYISIDQPHDPTKRSSVGGQVGDAQPQARFEITDKSLDFLGYKAL